MSSHTLMIAVVDYGMGNLRSVEKALLSAGAKVKVTSRPQDVLRADCIVVPGVGAFDHAVQELKRRSLWEPVGEALQKGKPYVGLCLGLQLLFEASDEGQEKGWGVVTGHVKRFPSQKLKIPHMGWNQVRPTRGGPLWKGIDGDAYFYFVHSFYADPQAADVREAVTSYGREFTSVIRRGNIVATQFHPEKSQENGLRFLKNVLTLSEK